MRYRKVIALASCAIGLAVLGTEPAVAACGYLGGPCTPAPAAASGRDVEIAQRMLARLGLLEQAASGHQDAATTAAIRDFQHSNGLRDDGTVTPDLLRALRRVVWQKSGFATKTAKGQDAVLDAAGIREAQGYLTKLGYEPGPPDGTFGPQTQAAVESFQTSEDVTVDGLVTRTSLSNLKRAAMRKPSEMHGVVRLVNWPDYIDPAVLEEFEKETKIAVIYDLFNSYDELETRITEGRANADVTFPGADLINKLAAAGKLTELNKSKLNNIGNVDPVFAGFLNVPDHGNKFTIPYVWWTSGLVYDRDKVHAALPGQRVDLGLLFDPARVAKLASCGVVVNDTPEELVPAALAYLKENVATTDPAVLRKALPVLQKVKQYVKVIPNAEFVDTISKGKACVAFGFSGDVVQARNSPDGKKHHIEYQVPAEGGWIAFDAVVIPKSAPNPENAYIFLNYLLRPQIMAKITNAISYGNGNAASRQFIDPAITNDRMIYPEGLDQLVVRPPMTPEGKAELEKIWATFK